MKDINVTSVNNVLNMNLSIPDYQRPYCWSRKSVRDLLNDISNTYNKCRDYKDYKYRIGTIILYYDNDNQKTYEIVDGQQRIITLLLIKQIFNNDFSSYLFNSFKISDKRTIHNIIENRTVIKSWYDGLNNKNQIKKVFNNNLEFLVVVVRNIDEAFQLFDSQNSSGKELYPHDLLKAFHLREMENERETNILNVVNNWESEKSQNIANLFEYYLYPIKCWSDREGTHKFSSNDIDEYKGITQSLLNEYGYNYCKLFNDNNKIFQINLPFYSGNSFFKMVTYYLNEIDVLLKKVKDLNSDIYILLNSYLKKNNTGYENSRLKESIESKSLGMKYVCQMFFAALLFYYDRFNIIDKTVINKLFSWAFMLRVDLEMINMKSINKYALGEDNSNTTNHIPMFYLISKFRNHFEINDIVVQKIQNNDNWNELYKFINELDSSEEADNYE